jgi:type III secretion protein U
VAEKTQKPTRRRLREARKRGEVVRSRELNSLGNFILLWLFLGFGAGYLLRRVFRILQSAVVAIEAGDDTGVLGWLPAAQGMFMDLVLVLAPLLSLSVICAVLIGGLQTRGMISVTPIVPKFERISPAQGLRNLLSTRPLFELGKLLFKSALLIGASGYCLMLALPSVTRMVYMPVAEQLHIGGSLTWHLMGWAIPIYMVGALLDYAHQFHEFMKRQKMSIEEVRRDLREREGDPLIKARRRAIGREMAFNSPLAAANVVVVNPTHVSVALQYTRGKTPLPRVVAKGRGAVALRIRLEAERRGIPVVEAPALARKLFREVAIDEYIKDDLIDVVAAAFRWAQQIDRRPAQSPSRSLTQNPTPRTV